jgi:hypothetical protein
MADLATLQGWITEAEAAMHALQTGKRVQNIWRDGRRIEFTPAPDSINRLKEYIADLNSQIATITGVASTDWRLNRTAGRFFFR